MKDSPIFPGDVAILRELATQVAEIAALPIQKERMALWNAMNTLHPIRPVVVVYPGRAWAELVPEQALGCRDSLFRTWERELRMTLFCHEYIQDDRPLHREFHIPWVLKHGDIGVEIKEVHAGGDGLGAVTWTPPIQSMADLEKLRFRTLTVDREETRRQADLARDILGDLLDVRVFGGLPFWSVGVSNLIKMRGLQQTMLDLYLEPELIHGIMKFLRDDRMQLMDAYEKEGLLSLNNHHIMASTFCNSGHEGYCSDLPAVDYRGQARWKDLWGLGEMQEFSGVGPEQFNEFSLQYQVPLLKRYGLTSYGCCEPLDNTYDMLFENIPNLRRLSVTSPWADKKTAVEKIGRRAVLSWKFNPSATAAQKMDWDSVAHDIGETIDIARGTCLEIVARTTLTYCHEPQRITRWVQTVRRLIDEKWR